MSGSDSDLEFESADEGGVNEDISDIDLSDLEEKNDETKESNKAEIVSTKEATEEEPSVTSERVQIDDSKKEIFLEEPKFAPDRVEGDDDIEQMLNDMGIDESHIKQTNDMPRDEQTISNQSQFEAVETPQKKPNEFENIKNQKTPGWDEDELEINDDLIEETVQSTKNAMTNVIKEDKLLNEQQQPPLVQEPPKKESSGWSWSSFGTNFISTAVGSLNTVLETVEATIGAPGNLNF